ncbi:16S rRNA (uracil(1498)-N(3))-methyltransferase [Campylobacter hepaticus]|uniref:Ribosomal RNA small subunit methyltransferase E n=1 Tax=Campylobacter hepaticus TaxID=1813019 RepID=A0A424Z0S5_9BACT|nr:16S rRNA (uracil(1498)-N(3))-methyltransferase [Campylobacter hepaticus]AXP09112.1 16S rRNA (uracil(1498)-N(3))-methyltransferase [Campylobacter hepaticus]MCZ0771604.1 16S rRNA (uracil(1498)-N(3))-methyltransferase [Campylobacter hepaticus]MCZ0773072.1 16S rRNA (uracil(1498)-N(3))-methyltransferase [Campylobacter hepaticus]MCZ0775752.1 16S rRNA (uracil(1498)-N(3))-methyltransferase [Campylobacter hepaticus]MDX2323469.1 16S rRNA (uracil(1498)-N(3))-methyltransferase [Campylobacter hepaticus]
MQFLYHEQAGQKLIQLQDKDFNHLKVRRVKENTKLNLRNLQDHFLYEYTITHLKRNSCILKLSNKFIQNQEQSKLSLALAVIDTKVLEKTLPFLNELGVKTLHLVFTHFSQRNFKIDLKRLEKIIIASCEQCGRNVKMNLNIYKSTQEFAQKFPNAIMIDFEGEQKSDFKEEELYFIGPEGGFNKDEKIFFHQKIALKTSNILKSQNAVIAIAAKILI